MIRRHRTDRRRDHSPAPAREHRTERLTVEIGSYNGEAITVTYTIEATLWSRTRGLGGYVSARPGEVHLPDGGAVSLG